MQNQCDCLLIDNDQDDCEIFLMALQEVDPALQCQTTNDGITALQKFKADISFCPSLIFIDMNMPLINGKQCLEQLKKIERLKEIPIYIYSTSADPRTVAEVKLLGATDFIVKPSGFTELTQLLTRLFQFQKLLP